MTLRALVVDDEPLARVGLAAMLEPDDRIDVVGTCANVDEATAAIAQLNPDVVFLDIEMPGGSGFDLLDRIESSPPPSVVFVTAFEEYAVDAFEVRAVDYLLKPFSDARLRETVDRLQARDPDTDVDLKALAALLREQASAQSRPLTRLTVRRHGRTDWIPVVEVETLRADGDYIEVTTVDGRQELVRGPLGRLEARLDPHHFIRTHRSWMVRLDRVRTLRLRSAGTAILEMTSGSEVPVSARRRRRLELRLES